MLALVPEDGHVPAGEAAVPPLFHPASPLVQASTEGCAEVTTVSNIPPPESAVIVTVHVLEPPVKPAALKASGFANASAMEKLMPVLTNCAPAKVGAVPVDAGVME